MYLISGRRIRHWHTFCAWYKARRHLRHSRLHKRAQAVSGTNSWPGLGQGRGPPRSHLPPTSADHFCRAPPPKQAQKRPPHPFPHPPFPQSRSFLVDLENQCALRPGRRRPGRSRPRAGAAWAPRSAPLVCPSADRSRGSSNLCGQPDRDGCPAGGGGPVGGWPRWWCARAGAAASRTG